MIKRQLTASLIAQIKYLEETYDCNLFDISEIRELAYREGFIELYNIVTETPTRYYRGITEGFMN